MERPNPIHPRMTAATKRAAIAGQRADSQTGRPRRAATLSAPAGARTLAAPLEGDEADEQQAELLADPAEEIGPDLRHLVHEGDVAVGVEPQAGDVSRPVELEHPAHVRGLVALRLRVAEVRDDRDEPI